MNRQRSQQAVITGIGAITPVGGLCFIVGWLLLAAACAKQR